MLGEGDQQVFVRSQMVENGAEKARVGGGGAQILGAEARQSQETLEALAIVRQPGERGDAQVLRFGFACG
jgi:hypothetical protein